METVKHGGAVDEAEDTDELLCTDVDGETVSDFGLVLSAAPRDHCDLLLDAIDAHLSCLQIQSQGNGGKNKTEAILSAACLDRSNSASKDTGLGSTAPSTDNAASIPDGSNSDHPDLFSVDVSRGRVELARQQEENNEEHAGLSITPSWQRGRARGQRDSKSEQCLWRLERLLGTSTRIGVKEQEVEEEDSVCTEDFSARFREEMLELQEPHAGGAGTATDAISISSDTGLLTESQIIQSQNTIQNLSGNLKSCIKHLAGVPMRSFDSVTIDSDLDSVCTERIRRHFQTTLNNSTGNITALEMFVQSGSCARRLQTTKQSETQTLSSDDEGTVGGENVECVRRYRSLRAPTSIQRREKKNQSRRNNSTTSTPATTSKEKEDDELRTEFSDLDVSIAGLQQQKAAAVQVVERLREEVEEAEREQHTLQLSVTQTRTHAQLLRSELHKLQTQRDLCVKEVRVLQEDQAALQRHTNSCYHVSSPHKHMNSSCVSVLEREELDRLLDSTKSELFSEQRRFRKKLDSMQERLEEMTQELEQREEQSRKLKEKCSDLKEKLTTAIKHRDELQQSVQSERAEQMSRLGALEKIIAQKELLLLNMQEEKSSLQTEIITGREEHSAKLTAALAQAQKEKDEEVERLKVQLIQTHEHQLKMVRSQADEVRAAALREQALTHTRNSESLHHCIQLKEQEVKRLQESLKQQKEVLKKREEELRGEAEKQVQRAVKQEQDKFEEQMQEVEKRGKAEMERERRNALALQNKVVELQTQVEQLESEASVQTARLKALRDEHKAELQRLRRQLKQEAESEAVRLKQSVKQSEKQLQDLKSALAECERVLQGAAEKQEQQNAAWTQDIHTECVCLQELLTHNGLRVDTKHLSHSATVTEAVQVLQSLRKPLQHLIISLQNRISSLTHTNQQISAEKEMELRLQREQLTVEKERAVNVLKEKLIQEHIEELSSMSRVRLGEDDEGLRRQLQAKDEELRQVQRNMAQWKEKTTKRLAQKFEEEFSTELERRVSKPKLEPQQRLELLEGEMRHLTRNYRDQTDIHLASASSANVPDSTNTPSTHDLASYKLLRHLQSRIRQLQADNQTRAPSPVHLNGFREAEDLAGSYLETIAPAQESYVSKRSSVRTTPS